MEQTNRKGARASALYLWVLTAAGLGVLIGLFAPSVAVKLKPLGTAFINLVKMMIGPIIFTTLVLGISSVKNVAKVGRVGGMALAYFLVMTSLALVVGLLVGNLLHPGAGMNLSLSAGSGPSTAAKPPGAEGFLLEIIPQTLVSALTSGVVLQTVLVSLLVGFAVQSMGAAGQPVVRAIELTQRVVFKVLSMVMWMAPLGAFGAMAAVVGETGVDALKSLAAVMVAFYATCILFVLGVLGPVLWLTTGISVFALLRYLGSEFLLIISTSSSETALPLLIEKLEHLGAATPVVGIVVPCGYSFNLDGTAIYLTMASLFVANAAGHPMGAGEQVMLLLFMIIASKGAAAVTGAGLATLSAGLQSYRPDLVSGVGIIVGIDRFMSEARALTNFAGNAVATLVIASWTSQLDKVRVAEVLSGKRPFEAARHQELADPLNQ